MVARDDWVIGVREPGHARRDGEPTAVVVLRSACWSYPTHGDAEIIGAFVRAARATLPEAHVIVCDDSSTRWHAADRGGGRRRDREQQCAAPAGQAGFGRRIPSRMSWGAPNEDGNRPAQGSVPDMRAR
jgi:hypothetical protein